jgi:hypothetical protein
MKNPNRELAQKFFCRLRNRPRRGPYCGAPTPTPVPSAQFVGAIQRVDHRQLRMQFAGAGEVEIVRHIEI